MVLAALAGTTSSPKSFQYVATSQAFPVAGLHKFILYDQTRQSIYLSSTDHIDLFHLATQSFGAPLSPFPGGPPPNVALRGLALTPDHSQLIAADFGGQSVYLVNPDQPTNAGAKVPVGGVAGFLNGLQLFAATTSGPSIVKLANVPLGIGSLVPSSGAAAGGTSITLRGSGFQSATKVTIGGKGATVSFKDMNTLTIVTPALAKGPQQLVVTNPDDETVSLDAAFLAQ